MKYCTGECGRFLPLNEFNVNNKKPDGLQPFCKDCSNRRNREWYQKNKAAKIARSTKERKIRRTRRKEAVWSKAEELGCLFCPEADRVVLDFHHLEGKEFNISEAIATDVAWNRILSELTKCIVVCSNCHRRVHAGHKIVPNNAPRVILEYDDAG